MEETTEMNDIYTTELLGLGVTLTEMAVKGTATKVSNKIRAIKEEKNVEKIRNTYDEIINELLNEREEAVRIAQAYKAELENILNNTFKEIEDITDVHQMTNQQLKRLIQKIEVDKEGNVDIYLRLLGDFGLDESVLIEENETVLKCNDQT